MQTILFFDLDSTLVHNRFSRKAVGDVLDEIAAATDQTIEQLGRAMSDENQRRQRDDPHHPKTMDWNDIVQELAQQHGVTLSQTVDELWQAYAAAEDVEILDNAPQVLEHLQAPHRQLVLATKGLSKYQRPVLRVTGLDAYFDDVLTPDITGYLKTGVEYYARYRDTDALCIQIGDHYVDDILCAKQRGCLAILRAPIAALRDSDPLQRPAHLASHTDQIATYPDEGTDVLPDAVVVTLEEVPALVEHFEAQAHSGT